MVLVAFLWWAFRLPWPGNAELRLSLAGMTLQLMGVGTVAAGIGATRKRLKKPPIMRGIWDHLAGLLKKPQNISHIVGTANIHVTGGAMSASATHAHLTASLEDHVKRLETELNANAQRLSELANQIREEAAAREQAIGGEQNARTEADRELRQALRMCRPGE